MATKSEKIVPCLAFIDHAEEAAKFYVSLFKEAKILTVSRSTPEKKGGKKGVVRAVAFSLFGQRFLAINTGQDFRFTHAISLMANCADQKEIDRVWKKLAQGGKEIGCGWVQDKFGVSWQVIPSSLNEMMASPDAEKAGRVMAALVQMTKLDLKTLERAYAGNGSGKK